ncbi:MAG: hypothetical protein Q4P30_06060, partial [Eubacteriales bacterium]|nr:hypothetical protein [Eubacteriales bacterium]
MMEYDSGRVRRGILFILPLTVLLMMAVVMSVVFAQTPVPVKVTDFTGLKEAVENATEDTVIEIEADFDWT